MSDTVTLPPLVAITDDLDRYVFTAPGTRVLTYPEVGERSTQLAGELARMGHEVTRNHDVITVATGTVRILPSGRVCVWPGDVRTCDDLDWTDAVDVARKVLAVL